MRVICLIAVLLAASLLLCGCETVVRGPADELMMYSWSGKYESGAASLSFEGGEARLSFSCDDHELVISGLCAATDDTLVIIDDDSKMNYSFGYKLNGESVELSAFSGTLTLDKSGDHPENK